MSEKKKLIYSVLWLSSLYWIVWIVLLQFKEKAYPLLILWTTLNVTIVVIVLVTSIIVAGEKLTGDSESSGKRAEKGDSRA